MVRKTRRHTSSKKAGVSSIPELRRSFEYIEEFVDNKLRQHESRDKICKDLRKEWRQVFMKDLNKTAAAAFVEDRAHHTMRRRTIRRKSTKGGSLATAPLAGAPLEYATRAGVYLAPGQIPQGEHLPMSNGSPSSFGSYVDYISKGFTNPAIGQTYDPVQGQAPWPVPYESTGNNTTKGGSRSRRHTKRRVLKRGGGLLSGAMSSTSSFLDQVFTRPIFSTAPPTVFQDGQDGWHGKQLGMSPDQVQRPPSYLLGSVYPKEIHI